MAVFVLTAVRTSNPTRVNDIVKDLETFSVIKLYRIVRSEKPHKLHLIVSLETEHEDDNRLPVRLHFMLTK
jgi:hypothetical protein